MYSATPLPARSLMHLQNWEKHLPVLYLGTANKPILTAVWCVYSTPACPRKRSTPPVFQNTHGGTNSGRIEGHAIRNGAADTRDHSDDRGKKTNTNRKGHKDTIAKKEGNPPI